MKRLFFPLLLIIILSCQSNSINKKNPVKEEVSQKKTFLKLEKERYNVAFLIMDGTHKMTVFFLLKGQSL